MNKTEKDKNARVSESHNYYYYYHYHLTDIPLGKQLRRESLTPAKVFENNVSTLRLGPSSGNKEMTTVNGNLSTEM